MPWSGFASSALGAAGSIAGGLLSNRGSSSAATEWLWKKNYEAQKEFAQNGIRWKVADAKAAGLHPLAALGSSSFFTPSSSVGDTTGGYDASWLADAGQSIGRAIEAKATAAERAKAEKVNDEANQIKLDNGRLQNEQLQLENQRLKNGLVSDLAQQVVASQRSVRNSALPPAMPSLRTRSDGATVGTVMPGQGDSTTSSLFTVKPAEIIASDPQTPYAEGGSHPDEMWVRTNSGGWAPLRSTTTQQGYEDDWLGGIQWNVRNRLRPAIEYHNELLAPPAHFKRDPRNFWRFDPIAGEWVDVPTAKWVRRRASKVTY